jgi:hypothetical protein
MLHLAHGQATAITARLRAWRGLSALGLRLRVWASSLELDCRLAEGVRPASSPELALRAQQLTSARSRDQLSSALIATIDAARRPRVPSTCKAPIVATAVLEAAGPMRRLAQDLKTIDDPPVRGVAFVSFLVCDPTSPLYNRHSPVTVREIIQRARSVLVPR